MEQSTNELTLTVEGFTPYAQIPRWVLRAGKNLSHGAVRLYGVIMTYADNDSRTAFPGRDKLAEDLGVKARSITNYIQELEDYGALKVLRRRNKRTGNYYANQYTLVFNEPDAKDCTRQSAENCSIPKPTDLTTSTSFTSDQRSETHVAPALLQSDGQDDSSREKAAQADPISPAFYESEDRKALITNVQYLAAFRKENKNIDQHDIDAIVQRADQWDNILGQFSRNLNIAFQDQLNDEYTLDHMFWDYAWEPPMKAADDRFSAAKWFNTFINSLQHEVGQLTWRGDSK